MGRYDQNPTKKNNATTVFVVTVVIALTLGIVGNYYVLKRYRTSDQETVKTENTNDASDTKGLEAPVEKIATPSDNKLTLSAPDQYRALENTYKTSFKLPSPLPDLLSSDTVFRRVITQLSPDLAFLLTSDQLIRRFLIVANDFSQDQRIAGHMSFVRLEQPFTVEQTDNSIILAPDSYSRYDKLTQAIQLIDPKAAVAVYNYFRPLMLQVFAEFSYPADITLESVIKKAAAEIIAAPVIDQPIALVRPSVYYKFADNSLETLSPVQKQILRMGPQNTRMIQNKLREFMVEFAKQATSSNTQH